MELENQFTQVLGKSIADATRKELYAGLVTLVKQRMTGIPETEGKKKLYYISAEFLTGKQLGKNLINLGIYDEIDEILRKNGKQLSNVEDAEEEPSLGNGGLGRLAACFMDSIATLGMAGDGIGLRYHFGLFKQEFIDHKQHEVPDTWLGKPCWLEKTDVTFPIELAGKTYHSRMYNLDVIGYKNGHNQLHLFDLDSVDESIVHDGIEFDKTDIAKNLTLFLYPDDSDKNGQLLRIYQQYFMVSNAAQMIIKEEKDKGHDLHHLDDYIAIQINDTHPSMVIPELVRLLIKEGMSMKEAANIVTNVCAYTNHTILAEALEKWPMDYLNEVVPQLMPIIGGLDYAVVCAYNDNENLNIISKDNRVHMARIDMHYGHSINGVAALHTEILKQQELRPFFDIYPDKFNNKTNGITFRRWLMHCDHTLSTYIDQLIGESWKSDADHLQDLMQYYNNEDVLNQLDAIKHQNKVEFAAFIKSKEGIEIDPDSIFDVQVKRMHEYKRQQMNALWIIYEYLRIKNGQRPAHPITVIFGGKAAPAYYMAKDIIHLILCLQELINNDPEVSPWLKVVMIKNYNISKAEKTIPAADVSEQISLASKEASGTGNMKFMLNGAVTLGTADGANVEIRDLVGHENIYVFGRTSDEVINLYNTSGYHAHEYYDRSESIHRVIDFITGPELSKIGDPALLGALKDNLINKDWFMTLLDLESYCNVKETLIYDYQNREKWKRMALVNIAKAGFFSSDRTIAEYNRDIWHLR
ncbi:MAG: glycogen/starch/alpha-glucan family phosphorylase [Solobacterium sp.]|jgi:starch phosphorylase|nr:glycogen/starch/alpha-glucan family phosphorylase [Solobacterium sp.]MCH4222400.1 glycogen/starch/alpha-glucan family phosphorylase [Solobacterium sp.]MCH4265937.1 glycogen/starch/alpha-glucan family phosphorylase [Solobacterium sp.]